MRQIAQQCSTPQQQFTTLSRTAMKRYASVTGPVYTSEDPSAPIVRLFTKEGCTLCDKVKDVLREVKDENSHSLEQVDITDAEHDAYWDRYKYDIPVLHVNGEYWIKHKLTVEEAIEALTAVKEGKFQSPPGEPNAKNMEH
jgi:glutaredoxin